MAEEEVRYLLDASALYPLLKKLGSDLYDALRKAAILDLTKYEVGNAIWVEARRGLIREWREVARAWSKILERAREIKVFNVEGIEELAIELNLTFYDAAYAYAASRAGLTLVTEDQELGEKASSAGVKTISVEEFMDSWRKTSPHNQSLG
ncbi:MAG: type II toxin-antitoxin system VapC family toxin [Thermoproteales archaeon]|nr:type II toxin-antitoxin system VapC family toxin [Thermoproteales archaeon]